MSATDDIEKAIQNSSGNVRDALNVALTRNRLLEISNQSLRETIDEYLKQDTLDAKIESQEKILKLCVDAIELALDCQSTHGLCPICKEVLCKVLLDIKESK